jgi:hypothetical protein
VTVKRSSAAVGRGDALMAHASLRAWFPYVRWGHKMG